MNGNSGAFGASGGSGAIGASGSVGATGATGTSGGIDGFFAPWHSMMLGISSFSLPEDVAPSCFPDSNGQVYLRGSVSLTIVPARGGNLLAILPFTNNTEKKCGCTPDLGEVIVTSSAIAFNTPGQPMVAQACIVRLIISEFVRPDVNRDYYINDTDIDLVQLHQWYSPSPSAPSKCPDEDCGPYDVNQDGRLNQLDVISIRQSGFLGMHVPCGGVYASFFSCGSSLETPLVPALGISFDNAQFYVRKGIDAEGTGFMHQRNSRKSSRSMESRVLDQLLQQFDSHASQIKSQEHLLASQRNDLKALGEALEQRSTKDCNHQRSLKEALASQQNDLRSLKEAIKLFAMTISGICAAVFVAIIIKRR